MRKDIKRIIVMSAVFSWAIATIYGEPCLNYDKLLNHKDGVTVHIPRESLAPGSLAVSASHDRFADWTAKEHEQTYTYLQAISSLWSEKKKIDQYIIFGEDEGSASKAGFRWEIVPYQSTSNLLTRFQQQLSVLWAVTFGASPNTDFQQEEIGFYQQNLLQNGVEVIPVSNSSSKGDDSFCSEEVILKQRVLEGTHVDVLYNHAPIGFGDEKLHFLFVPKEHRRNFKDLTQEEYTEAQNLAARVLEVFRRENMNRKAYLFHKTGPDAGQTVAHWHLHLVITSKPAQDYFGKLTALWNMVFGSTPLSDEELQEKVEYYKTKLA